MKLNTKESFLSSPFCYCNHKGIIVKYTTFLIPHDSVLLYKVWIQSFYKIIKVHFINSNIILGVILGRDCCRFLVEPFLKATVSPRCFTLLFFSLLLPPSHRVKAEQYKELVFSLGPSLIILDSNIISKVIAAFCCTWMKNSTYMGPQIEFAAEKLQPFFAACGWKMLLVAPEVLTVFAINCIFNCDTSH